MADIDIRPSVRQAHALLVLCAVPVAALLRYVYFTEPDAPKALLLAGLLPLVFPLRLYLKAWSRRLVVEDGVARLKEGLLSQRETALALERLEKSSVRRTFWQRMWGIGDLVLESAAESGGIAMEDIDDPQAVERELLQLSRAARGKVR